MNQKFFQYALRGFLGLLWICLPAQIAQGQSAIRDQDYMRDVIALSETLGKAHAIRVTCNGRNDQYWRSYMLRLLELEAPYSGGLRRSLVNGFNAGFSIGLSDYSVCNAEAREAEQLIAQEGQTLSQRLVETNINSQGLRDR